MNLGKVIGTVVATRKDSKLDGCKMLIVQLIDPDGKPEGGYVVAIDTVGAGAGETVLIVRGSSARMTRNFAQSPVDAAIAAIVDTIDFNQPKKKSK